jgi:S-adenosylmethionine decarboxylase
MSQDLGVSSSYGMHLTLLLHSPDGKESLDDPLAVEAFLVSLVARAGMRILDGPHVCTEPGGPEKYGHSGVVVLYESHAAIHTYPALHRSFLDLFSCRPFRRATVLEVYNTVFSESEVLEEDLSPRGRHWLGVAKEEMQQWKATR